MSGIVFIETGISEAEQVSNHQNASLHGGPNGTAVSIDVNVKFPEGVITEEEMKVYLQKELSLLRAKGWSFNISIGSQE